MHMATVIAILLVLQCSELCWTIKVPNEWNDGANSEVQQIEPKVQGLVETFNLQNVQKQPILVEYFQYPAKKPQFAVDVATFHGVQSPKQHYKAYPIKPYTGKEKPQLGQHQLLNEDKAIYQSYQNFVKKNEEQNHHVLPVSSNYEVFHPYKAEQPALQEIYKDPVLNKIRSDLRDTKNRLQNYEKEAGESDITKAEYLESLEEIDRRKVPQKNIPTEFEIHRFQRRPIYYLRPQKVNNRDQILNQKFRHPWNQNYVKIRPVHYRPIKNHLQKLRQHHALTYDDERNEYPQVQSAQQFAEPPEGYDIFEKGKEKYVQLRNHVDESIDKSVKENRPTVYQKLKLQSNEDKIEEQRTEEDDNDNEEEFVPVKNYAQVRKTETTKHLPREAALEDADNYDEIKNAPRLREAIKSTKAQTIYTEEGYEDTAYDHAGEQKHASDHEDHGGYLKQKEVSEGKYKIPSLNANYEDGKGSAYRDQTLHGEKWKNDSKDNKEEVEAEDYSEEILEHSAEVNAYHEGDDESKRIKRENDVHNDTITDSTPTIKVEEPVPQRDIDKQAINFEVPEIDLGSTFLSGDEISKIAEEKIKPEKEDIKEKYPYYFGNSKSIHKDSPLRYAENLKFIPKKTIGGTEFYDSRSEFECPEVDDEVDPIPENLKKGDNMGEEPNDDNESKGEGQANFDHRKEQPRLRGLGDKIDCFKAKYFGRNPLDSPFFNEDIITNPEPVTAPNLSIYQLKKPNEKSDEFKFNNDFRVSDKLREENKQDIYELLDKLKTGQDKLQQTLVKTNEELRSLLMSPQNINVTSSQQATVYTDIIDNIKTNLQQPVIEQKADNISANILSTTPATIITVNENVTYNSFQNKQDVTKPPAQRKKRAAPFVYEPYKIIRDSQVQDSKKTTTTSNISPLIKQLQSSRVVDKVSKNIQDKEQPVKRNVGTRSYKDIGRKDREKTLTSNDKNLSESSFVDVNIDQRRGEPRYELKPANHKPQYTPVENKTTMSVEDYEAQTKLENDIATNKNETITTQPHLRSRQRSNQRRVTTRPFFDVSKFFPKSPEVQTAASKTVSRIIKTTTLAPEPETPAVTTRSKQESDESDEDYEEYDEEEETIITTITTTTTTTAKPAFRRRARIISTAKPTNEKSTETLPKLRLITRFRNHPVTEKTVNEDDIIEKPLAKGYNNDNHNIAPKYREKKRKSTKSTLVTDVKSYGNDDDADMMKEEVDALIGVKHDMNDYIPEYEKEMEKESRERDKLSSESSDEDDEEYDEDDDEEDDEEDHEESDPKMTTPEPSKRTLIRTTEAPVPTTEIRNLKLEEKPIITKKKIEIHKELPVNKSLPHVTQFKQDIKEVEIIKEMPVKKQPQKNKEALELYKDENLAKEVNKLGDVEVFKKIDLANGPKHGGNYRQATSEELSEEVAHLPKHGGNLILPKEDAEASQSENTRHIELDDNISTRRMHGGNLKSIDDYQRSRKRGNRNEKFTEFSDVTNRKTTRAMHGGNLRSINDRGSRRENKNAELIELDDDQDEEDDTTSKMHGGNFKTYGSGSRSHPMHGGNYRSAKIIKPNNEAIVDESKMLGGNLRAESKDARSNAAVLLNSFAQVVPILTTTPAYILDPSKRMYYYVEA